jgi:hypothetical protein
MCEFGEDAMAKLAVFAMLAFAAFDAQAQSPSPATLWYNAGHVTLAVTGAAADLSASWQFDRADNGDIRIVKEEQRGAATKVSGTLMSVCSDRALLFKGIVPLRRHELQELNEPVLHLQLVLRLLALALPQGPLAVGAQKGIELSDQKTRIQVRKGPTVRRDFDAPWQTRGTVSRDAAGDIKFDLVFSYAGVEAKDGRPEFKLAGVWQQQSRVRTLDNTFALTDWQVYRVDTVANIVGGNMELDVVAATQPLKFSTLGELRTRIERNWDQRPGARKQTECEV